MKKPLLILALILLSLSLLQPKAYISPSNFILPPNYYEEIPVNTNGGLYIYLYANSTVYFTIKGTSYSDVASSFYSYFPLPPGSYCIIVSNNVSNSVVDVQLYYGSGRPAPTGIADYGIELNGGTVKPYVEEFNGVIGVAQIYSISALNGTNYGASLQLNTVLQVNTVQGTQQYWLQNVIQFITNESIYRYVDNVWNFTSSPSELNSSLIHGEGYVYTTGILSPCSYYAYATQYFNMTYPFYAVLFISVQTIPQGVLVHFGYLNGSMTVWYDNVTINISGIESAYLLVDGYNVTGSGNAYDTELVFGGISKGEITYYNSLNAMLYFVYVNSTNVITPKALLPFGLDTAEASDNLFTTPYQGAYKVKVGNGEETYIPTISTPFKAQIINGSKEIDLGQRDYITVNVTGGQPPYLINIGNKSFIDFYVGNYTISYEPSVGNQSLQINVYDLKGDENTLYYNLTVNPDPVVGVKISNVTDVGVPIVAIANASLGTKPYHFAWYINGNLVSKENVLKFNFSSVGTYNVTFVFTDSAGYEIEKEFEVTINPDPVVNASLSANKTDVGVPINLSLNYSLGTQPYKTYIYLNGSLINEKSINFSKPGVYNITVVVMDSAGYKVIHTFYVTVIKDPQLSVNVVTTGNFFIENSGVTLSGITSGGIPPYTYYVYLNGKLVYTENSLSGYSLSLNIGNNNVTVVVKDSLGVVSEQSYLLNTSYNLTDIAVVAILIIVAIVAIVVIVRRK